MIVDDVGAPVAEPRQAEADQPAERRGERRVQDHGRHVAVQRERAAAVEAVPADPEHEHAERRERQVVAADRARRRGRSGRSWGPRMMIAASAHPASHRVHDGGSCEVDEAELLQPAVRAAAPIPERRVAPRPVAEDRVRDSGDEGGEDEVAGEAHALGDRPGHERRRGTDEPELEDEEGGQEGAVAVEEERRRADEAALAAAEHQRRSRTARRATRRRGSSRSS